MKIMTSAFSRTVVHLRVSRPGRALYVEGADWIEKHAVEIGLCLVAITVIGVTLISFGYVDDLRLELSAVVHFLYK